MKNILKVLLVLFMVSCTGVVEVQKPGLDKDLPELLTDLQYLIKENNFSFKVPPGTRFTDFSIDSISSKIIITSNKEFSNQYYREDSVEKIYSGIKNYLGEKFSNYDLQILSLGVPVEELIPNFYRDKIKKDTSRLGTQSINRPQSVVRNISRTFIPSLGLSGRNIALWPSHGRYYNSKLDRWMWQRARLFQMIEDLGPLAFTNPYLVPMLENAGANVFLPRERDTQTNEVVVDNDSENNGFVFVNGQYNRWIKGSGNAFALGSQPYPGNYNPFNYGTHLITNSELEAGASVSYIPDIPEEGEYSVYISYNSSGNNVTDAHYTVFHTGGITEFEVNQQIGGNTWIYLGEFKFAKGSNPNTGKVVLDNKSAEIGKFVSADAVRFGGGMGVIERGGRTSGFPKFMEGARYFLQYSGMPDTLIYNINGDTLDYNDDYQSRGEWVNYLVGAPYGPNKNREVKGLGIPVDLSLAFHTDAGITRNDSAIGTLSIYSTTDIDSSQFFPDGISRMANRDLADILQTQIVDDIRIKYDSLWTRRSLRDARYSEATRLNVPSVLLELLSHQNFYDSKFQLDPRYRFDIARSIYKSAVKFIAGQNNLNYVIQPLPVTNFYTELNKNGFVKLSWKPQSDEIEPTAEADKYIVYRRIGNSGFDNGTLVNDTTFTFTDTKENVIYGFKVTAINDGGESFPSEILSVCSLGKDIKPVLIINGFDRVSGPANIKSEFFTGYLNNIDAGVPDKYDLCFTGLQHNFNPSLDWTSDDMPGHGASYADYETKIIAGNTFDYPYVHGKAIAANGYAFVSASDEAVWDGQINLNGYRFVDLIMGEEKTTQWPAEYSDTKYGMQFETFPDPLKSKISDYLNNGGSLFVSGAYIGTDLFRNKPNNHKDAEFGKNYLKFRLATDHAVKTGKLYSNNELVFPKDFNLEFNTDLNDSIYAVEAPDALGETLGSKTILRYSENQISAATAYKGNYGVVAFGFPFETILGYDKQKEVMKFVLNFMMNK
ncbi:MAG: xanthan lyase [Bacteroidetes bacterium]|nr:xanthan lyase [Bacteroidota bacterium]